MAPGRHLVGNSVTACLKLPILPVAGNQWWTIKINKVPTLPLWRFSLVLEGGAHTCILPF